MKHFGCWALVLAIGAAAAWPTGQADAETKSFVLSWFYPANYYDKDTCPEGLNPLADVFFKRDLRALGLPQAEIDDMFDKDYNIQQGQQPRTRWTKVAATRGNGVDNVYVHPTTIPDANLKLAQGRLGYGFNLDGKGAQSPNGYEDPETHEKGVNNQLFRAIGCIQSYRGGGQRPLTFEYKWHAARNLTPAWIISITGDDLSKDGNVTVDFDNAIESAETVADGNVQPGLTYRVDPSPRTRNRLKGKIERGVVTTEPADINLICDAYLQPAYNFRQARMRLELTRDGTLKGMLGAYEPWYPFYWSNAKGGYIDERGFSVDTPGLFYALRKAADADPDPKTGENRAISSAYLIEAVPAFAVQPADSQNGPGAVRAKDATMRKPVYRRVKALLACGALFVCAAPGLARADQAPATTGGEAVTRLITPDQYRQMIADVFGPTIKIGGRFEPGIREDGLLAVGAGRIGVSVSGLEQYDSTARDVASQVVDERHRATLIPCKPAKDTAPDDICAAQFFSKVGPLLYRRSLAQDEVQTQVQLANAAAKSLKSFHSGLAMSLAGMLDSLPFLYRQEIAEPDPGHAGQYRLEAFSKASQLSFFLWNAKPDAELLAAAQSGALNSEKGLAAQVDRMLASPRLEAGIRAFFSDMLQFDGFDTLAKDSLIYPNYSSRVAADAQEQTLRTVVDHLLNQRGDYRDLFTTRKTFLSPSLGILYGVPVAKNAPGLWQPYEFPEGDPRAGILVQASFVALHSHPGRSSPTLRGKALRELVLCQKVPAPPGNVNFSIVEDASNPNLKTVRERLTAHRSNPTCAGCHKIVDPIGLAMENFDSAGGFRRTENGATINTSGELDGMSFTDAAGLAKAVHDDPATTSCLVNRVYAYGVGRSVTKSETDWIKYLQKSFAEDGYRVPDLLRRIAVSDAFYRIAAPQTGSADAPAAKLAAGLEASSENRK